MQGGRDVGGMIWRAGDGVYATVYSEFSAHYPRHTRAKRFNDRATLFALLSSLKAFLIICFCVTQFDW